MIHIGLFQIYKRSTLMGKRFYSSPKVLTGCGVNISLLLTSTYY